MSESLLSQLNQVFPWISNLPPDKVETFYIEIFITIRQELQTQNWSNLEEKMGKWQKVAELTNGHSPLNEFDKYRVISGRNGMQKQSLSPEEMLRQATQVYNGLTEEEIDEIESIALSSRTTPHIQPS